ncbi:nuclear transport factor 2 family protein [Kitasatospora sp. NPDC093558]|uniref:nuclear transport factor 2 family protein n=1 Tax=Kitasatospora sp. NPDC093558 TaxID=3155201 RepID=UPI00344389AA
MTDTALARLYEALRSRPRTAAFDPIPFLHALHEAGSHAVVIGQVAGILHGSADPTGDLDLLWDGSSAEAAALRAALTAAGCVELPALDRPSTPFRVPGADGDLCTPAAPWGGLDTTDCLAGAVTATDPSTGLTVRYAALDDLIRMRRALGRPKDHRRADELERLRNPTPLDVLARYRQAILDKDADALADLYAPDAVHEFPFLYPGMPERHEGREAVRAGYRAAWGASPAQPDEIREVAVHRSTDPEVITVEQVVAGTIAGTDRRFSAPGLLVIRVRAGRIVHVRDYMDGLGVAHAMGRLAAVAARLEGTA